MRLAMLGPDGPRQLRQCRRDNFAYSSESAPGLGLLQDNNGADFSKNTRNYLQYGSGSG